MVGNAFHQLKGLSAGHALSVGCDNWLQLHAQLSTTCQHLLTSVCVLTGVPASFCTDRNAVVRKRVQVPCLQAKGACQQEADALPVPQSACTSPQEVQRSKGDL